MHTKPYTLVITILALLLTLTACNANDEQVLPTLVGEDNQSVSDDNPDTSNADNVENTNSQASNVSFDDMESGTHDISISGAFTSDGSYSGGEITAYEPFNSSNTTGQHELEIYADIAPTDLTEETFVIVYLRFPADIAPGTYEIQTRDRNQPELVQGFVAFDNISVADFDETVSGTLEIVESGAQMTAVFNFVAHSGRDEELSVDVSGRVNQLPFNYRPETHLTLSGLVDREFTTLEAFEDDTLTFVYQYMLDDFSNEFRWDSNFRDNDFTFMTEVIFYLSSDIQPGTYDVAYAPPENQKVPEGFMVGARLYYEDSSADIDFGADSFTGTFTITVDERNYAGASFEIVGTDSETGESLTATGTFQYYESLFEG